MNNKELTSITPVAEQDSGLVDVEGGITIKEWEKTYIVAFLLAHFAVFALEALPWVRADDLFQCLQCHATRMTYACVGFSGLGCTAHKNRYTTTATFDASHHVFWFACFVPRFVPLTKAAFLLSQELAPPLGLRRLRRRGRWLFLD